MGKLFLLFAVSGLFALASTCTKAEEPGNSALSVFEQRIMPIFQSPKPSSCVQCHLSAVDIKDYILPSHEQTFASLRDQGLIDLENPQSSKILTLIRMGEKDLDVGARLIHAKTRQAELEAFSAWVEACCADPVLRSLPVTKGAAAAGPEKPIAVIRHARIDRVLDSFVRNVWSQRMRCFPCHTPNELDADNPQHEKPIQRQAEFVKQYGQRMNIFSDSPAKTMRQLIMSSRRSIPGRYPLINAQDPTNSLLVLKPTSKLPPRDDSGKFQKPSSKDPVSHMGGLKMHLNDQSYKSFVAWIQDYANVSGDRYTAADDLPQDNWVPTNRVLRVKSVPESWPAGSTVQLFVHGRLRDSGEMDPEPIAFTQGTVTPRRFVNGALFLLSRQKESGLTDSTVTTSTLSPGIYVVKAYVDRNNQLADNPAMFLSDADFAGKAEVEASWHEGFKQAQVVDGGRFAD